MHILDVSLTLRYKRDCSRKGIELVQAQGWLVGQQKGPLLGVKAWAHYQVKKKNGALRGRRGWRL